MYQIYKEQSYRPRYESKKMPQTRTEGENVKDPKHCYYVFIHLPAVECRAGVGPSRRGEELRGRSLSVREGQVGVPAEVVRAVACNQSVMLQILMLAFVFVKDR